MADGWGGPRQGVQGKAYANRSDLNAKPRLPATGRPVSSPAGLPSGAPAPEPVPLGAPTARPGEPVTAGLPVGPGPGPEVLGDVALGGRDDTLAFLRALWIETEHPGIAALIEEMESG